MPNLQQQRASNALPLDTDRLWRNDVAMLRVETTVSGAIQTVPVMSAYPPPREKNLGCAFPSRTPHPLSDVPSAPEYRSKGLRFLSPTPISASLRRLCAHRPCWRR